MFPTVSVQSRGWICWLTAPVQCAIHLLPPVGRDAQLHPCSPMPAGSRFAVLNVFDILPPLQLLLYERNWLNRWKMTVLHEGEGSITNIKWRANLIAWANNMVSMQPVSGQFAKYYVSLKIKIKISYLISFRGLKSMISVRNSASQMCCGTMCI